jgi:hypothetical protein
MSKLQKEDADTLLEKTNEISDSAPEKAAELSDLFFKKPQSVTGR